MGPVLHFLCCIGLIRKELNMGKDLRNREIGKGISQRKDGKYSARFVNKGGKRVERYFDTLPQARNWLDDARYDDAHNTVIAPFEMVADDIIGNDSLPLSFSDMTVDEWFEFWIHNIVSDRSYNTLRNYKERYNINVKPVMGKIKVRDVKAMHCQRVLLDMEDEYAGSTIVQTYITMGTLFKSALMNDVISKHPMDGVRFTKRAKSKPDIKVLTIEEQKTFIEAARWSRNRDQYILIMETGLRTGELIGLTWDAVDFENKTLTIDKTLEYRHSRGTWEAGPPKSIASYRTIPLTARAFNILSRLYDARNHRNEAPELDQKLEYKDRLTGKIMYLNMKDLVFVSSRTGMPTKNSTYNTHLYKLCEDAGLKHISMHVLRHTYATRAIERGVNPKALQKLLGHASLQVTMDTYVHVTDDSKLLAVKIFEGSALSENGVEVITKMA